MKMTLHVMVSTLKFDTPLFAVSGEDVIAIAVAQHKIS